MRKQRLPIAEWPVPFPKCPSTQGEPFGASPSISRENVSVELLEFMVVYI